jgi:hypothetical protein
MKRRRRGEKRREKKKKRGGGEEKRGEREKRKDQRTLETRKYPPISISLQCFAVFQFPAKLGLGREQMIVSYSFLDICHYFLKSVDVQTGSVIATALQFLIILLIQDVKLKDPPPDTVLIPLQSLVRN